MINENGCSLDNLLIIQGTKYVDALESDMASWIFNFPDQSNKIVYHCKIRLNIKDGDTCTVSIFQESTTRKL